MKIRKTYWAAFLSVVLSFSLALPYCCHADKSEASTQTQVMVSQANQHHHGSDCKCGHELANDYQKNKKNASSSILTINFTGEFANNVVVRRGFSPVTILETVDFRALNWPSLHLLNSVFLN